MTNITRCKRSIVIHQLCSNQNAQQDAKKLRRGKSTPLMLFVEDLHQRGQQQTTGCAYTGAACGNRKDEALAIVDLTWNDNSRSSHLQSMARTMAHEFGHLVSTNWFSILNYKKIALLLISNKMQHWVHI